MPSNSSATLRPSSSRSAQAPPQLVFAHSSATLAVLSRSKNPPMSTVLSLSHAIHSTPTMTTLSAICCACSLPTTRTHLETHSGPVLRDAPLLLSSMPTTRSTLTSSGLAPISFSPTWACLPSPRLRFRTSLPDFLLRITSRKLSLWRPPKRSKSVKLREYPHLNSTKQETMMMNPLLLSFSLTCVSQVSLATLCSPPTSRRMTTITSTSTSSPLRPA